jgi:hypothetical protein
MISNVKRAGASTVFPSLVCEKVSNPANRTAFSDITTAECSSITIERGMNCLKDWKY